MAAAYSRGMTNLSALKSESLADSSSLAGPFVQSAPAAISRARSLSPVKKLAGRSESKKIQRDDSAGIVSESAARGGTRVTGRLARPLPPFPSAPSLISRAMQRRNTAHAIPTIGLMPAADPSAAHASPPPKR
jgi:hypothetical protein